MEEKNALQSAWHIEGLNQYCWIEPEFSQSIIIS